MFTCLASRAVHLEAIEDLSTASLINALRRFIAIRDPVIQFRSDRGTHFIGAVHELNIPSNLVETQHQKGISRRTRSIGCSILPMPPTLEGHGKE